MRVLDLFSGIGGFSLGLERAGMKTVAFCEIEEYPCKVLTKHWPDIPIYNDVRELTYDRLRADGITGIDVITGGFPCQDISLAGKQAGIDGERSGLWSECARLLREIRPRYAIFENVTALISGERGKWFERVLWDISQVGYDAEWHCIPASAVGAPHRRDRVWIICYPNENSEPISTINDEAPIMQSDLTNTMRPGGRLQQELTKREDQANAVNDGAEKSMAYTPGNSGNGKRETRAPRLRLQIGGCGSESNSWAVEPELGGTFNGIPIWLHRHCGRGLSYAESQRSIETLSGMWCDYVSETLWREIGGLDRIQQAEILFSIMREYEKGINETRIFLEGKKASKEFLRELRRKTGAPCSPYRPKHKEQPTNQHPDALQMVPQLPPCDSEENWQRGGWEDGIPRVANGIPRRVDRLKGLGNAVVPQIPEIIGRAIMAAEESTT